MLIYWSPSSRGFPIIWGRRIGIEYYSSTLSCPVHPPPLTPHFPCLFHTSLSTWFSVFLSVSFLVPAQLLYNQLSHLDTRHFVIIECRHLANGCVLQCGCIGLMLFHNLSCLDTIICYTNTIGIVPAYACNVCDALVASCTTTG